MLSSNKKLALTFLSISLILGLGAAKRYYFDESRYQFNDRLFVIGPEWVEITTGKSVACNAYYQEVVLTTQTPIQWETHCNDCPRIKLNDGKIVEIECILVSVDGQEYPCRSVYFSNSGEPVFKEMNVDETKARKRKYRAVKLRSNHQLLCAGARMECRNPPLFE